jgi:hypothetical protein
MASLQGTTVNGDLNTIGNSTSRSTLPAMSAVAYSWNDPVMSYNWTKVANLTGGDAHATLLITTKTDVNYIPYSIFLLSLSRFNSSTLSVKLDCLSSYDVNFTVRIDNSNDVWIQSQAQWTSYLSWRVISSLGTPTLYYSSFVQTITTPANSIAILPGQSVRCNQGAASSATVTNTNDHIFGGITSRGNINGNLVGNVTGTASGNLTSASSLTAGNLTGTIPSTVLGNSTVYIGTTGIALNRASAPQSLGVNIDGSSASCTGNAATATTSLRSTIEDTRAAQRTPNNYEDYRASYEFTDKITSLPDWHSVFTLQGWHDGYASWQIIGPSSTSVHENFYLRSGIGTTWNPVRAILHSGNYNSYAPTLTGGNASGSWTISVTGSSASCTGNAATVTNGVYTNAANTFTNTNVIYSPDNTFINTVTNANQALTMYQGTVGADAYMTFHIGGDFAGYFGLGGAENDLVWGGWSVGNARYRILHSGNQSFAWNLNQNLRTTDSPTFAGAYFSNNVGIGTTVPSSPLHLYSSDSRYLTFSSTGLLTLQRNVLSTSAASPQLTIINTQGSDAGTSRGVGIQLDLGYGGSASTVGTAARGSRIATLNETVYTATAADQNAALVFFTSSAGALGERMRISSGGNVTITGTISASNFSGTSTGTNTGDQTNISGNAATVTTNANLTGPVTSVGNATTITDDAITTAKILNNNVTYAKLQQVAGLSVVGNSTNSAANAANITGSANQVLRVSNDGTALAFGPVNLADIQAVTGTLPVSRGGTGGTTQATARTNGIGATTVGSNLITLADPGATRFIRINSDNTISALNDTDFRNAIGAGTGGGSGTVTSVSGTGTVSGLTLTGTVTTTGNLTLGGTLSVTASNFASQTANTFLAAPNGAAGTPTFRAIVAADIPTLNQNTIGTAANVTGTVVVGNGGTGATSFTAGRILFGNGTSAINTNANLFWDNTNTRLGVGTTAPAYTLDVGGVCHASSFPTSSDVRFKKNIQPLTNALQTILSLRGVKYEWNNFIHSQRSGYELNAPVIGMIAQEVENVIPEIVGKWALNENFQDARSLEYQRIIPYLIEAVKELDNKNKILEARILALENK